MNKERVEALIGWLESGAQKKGRVRDFDMSVGISYHPLCGSSCCLAGATVEFFGTEHADQMIRTARMNRMPLSISRTQVAWRPLFTCAMELLDLPRDAAEELFTPYGLARGSDFASGDGRSGWKLIGPGWAARCLRKLVDTGKVDWKGTKYAYNPPSTPEAQVSRLIERAKQTTTAA